MFGAANAPLEARWGNGQFDQLPRLASDLARLQVKVIVTATLPGTLAARAATNTIPIVFVIGEDPVKVGLVSSLSRPGGNITGITNFMNVLGAKRLELVSEAVPTAKVIALLVNPNNPNAEADVTDLQSAADALHRRALVLTATNDEGIERAFDTAVKAEVGALFVNIDPFLFSRRELIATIAARNMVPTIHPFREYTSAGGLMSYGANYVSAWHQAGIYVARILKGAKPADLPVLGARRQSQ